MKYIYKKILSILPVGLFIAVLSFSSCEELKFGNDFLDQKPEQIGINLDTVFSKKYYAMQVLTKAYTTLPYGIPAATGPKLAGDLLDAITDLSYSTLTYGGGKLLYYVGAYSAGKEGNQSKYLFNNASAWNGIRYGWLMVENVDRVPDMTELEKKRAKADAKLIIATHYADLLRHFGGFPYLDHAVTVNEAHYFERQTFEQSVSKIVGLINDAMYDLEWRVSDKNDDGRMTRAYAMGLKLRVLLFAASPLFNDNEPYLAGDASDAKMTWYGNYDVNRWKEAEAAGKAFMEELERNSQYDLVQPVTETVDGYREAFRKAYFTRDNGEVLLSVRRNYKNNYADIFCGDPNNYAQVQCPTLAYANLFPMADGNDFPADFDWASAPVDPFANRDPRFYETILTNDRPYKNRKSQLYVGGLDRTSASKDGTGLLLYKFSQDYTTATSVGAVDIWPAMRLAEVLLSYAEAINEANGGPNTEAFDLVDRVRKRVGLSGLDRSMDQKEFRQAVLRERACEFGYEEVRWFDIVRWKNAEAFKAPIQGVNMFIDKTKPTGYRYEIFTITPERVWKNQWSPKWYLSAFPTNEIDKAYGLVQNPGW